MLKLFKPTWMINSIFSITAEELKTNGINTVLIDLDNTLIAWNEPEATEDSINWILQMKAAGITLMILSNNSGGRVERVAEILDVEYIPRSLKPTIQGFKIAEKKLGVSVSEMVMVGDQLITDILGANRYGLRTILVKPLLTSDAWNTKFNRFIELKIMNVLIKSDSQMEWADTLDEKISK